MDYCFPFKLLNGEHKDKHLHTSGFIYCLHAYVKDFQGVKKGKRSSSTVELEKKSSGGKAAMKQTHP